RRGGAPARPRYSVVRSRDQGRAAGARGRRTGRDADAERRKVVRDAPRRSAAAPRVSLDLSARARDSAGRSDAGDGLDHRRTLALTRRRRVMDGVVARPTARVLRAVRRLGVAALRSTSAHFNRGMTVVPGTCRRPAPAVRSADARCKAQFGTYGGSTVSPYE